MTDIYTATTVHNEIDSPFGKLVLTQVKHVVFGASVFDSDARMIGYLADNYPAERAKIKTAPGYDGCGRRTISTSWDTLVYCAPSSSGQSGSPAVDPDIYRFVR